MSSYKQFCPVAMAAEVLETRWTLLIIRELCLGANHFNELRRGVPKMSPTLLSKRLKELEAQASIITAEAKGGWLQRNWRPMLMLTFAGLVVAHWFGFTAPNIPESVQNSLLNIVLVGMGGYIVGRSGEKIMDKFKELYKLWWFRWTLWFVIGALIAVIIRNF